MVQSMDMVQFLGIAQVFLNALAFFVVVLFVLIFGRIWE